jgi:uncharacterized membrane protein
VSTVAPSIRVPERAKVKVPRWVRAVLLLTPLAAVAVGYVLVFFLVSPRAANQALLAGATFLTFIGPSVIFTATEFDALGTWPVAAVVACFSVLTAFFYTYNLDLIERLPKVGVWLRRVSINTRKTLSQRPWIRRWTTVGVGFFVLLPLPGSGTLGGSLMGRLVGLTPRATFGAVGIAGVLVAYVYAELGKQIEHLPLWVRLCGAAVLFVILALLGRWLARQGRANGAKKAPARAK